MKSKITTIILGALLFTTLGVCAFYFSWKREAKATGIKAVELMYTFDTYEDVYSKQMKELQKICNQDVYKDLNVNNIDRALNSYLRFKGNASEVKIIEATNSYVKYSLNTLSISSERQFILFYHVNMWGKIDKVSECEIESFY